MSTFDGYVKEIPFISVDRFDYYREPMPKIYFLTHCHSDHTKNLEDWKFQNKLVKNNIFIYASPITVNVIKKQFPNIHSQLKETEVSKCTIIRYKDEEDEEQYLQVTAIPAGHCPGSVMFFFENKQNILCTGDFRINPYDLKKFEVFHTASGQQKLIDVIYLDSTFFSEEYLHFPTRQESCTTLCNSVKNWLDESKKNKVYLRLSAKYTAEFLLIELAKTLKEKIHIHPLKMLYSAIPNLDGIVTSKDGDYRIHSGGDFNKYFPCCMLHDEFILKINLSALKWKNFQPNDNPRNNVDDDKMDICVSFHSSCSEIKEFLRYLKPKHVELCVVPKNDDKRETMYKLLESIMTEIQKGQAQKCENKNFKFKHFDSFELKEHSSSSNWSSTKKKRQIDDLLSSPPRNKKQFPNI